MQELGIRWGLTRILGQLATMARSEGDYERAADLAQRCLAVAQETGDMFLTVWSITSLAEIARFRGDYASAEAWGKQGLVTARDKGNRQAIIKLLCTLGDVAQHQGDTAKASAHYYESLSLALKAKDRKNIGWCLFGLARLARAEGQFARAALLVGAAEAQLNVDKDMEPGARKEYDCGTAAIRAQLGEEIFATVRAKGQTMTPEEALAMSEQTSMSIPPAPAPPAKPAGEQPSTSTYPDDLTTREVEVLRLMARGWSNAQIAEQLVISPRTVNSHLTTIYRKIQVTSRSAATRYALEHHFT